MKTHLSRGMLFNLIPPILRRQALAGLWPQSCLGLLLLLGSLVTPGAQGQSPSIVTQPANQSIIIGRDVSLTVEATGAEPLACQWFHNGSALLDQTNFTCAIPSAQWTEAGNYYAVVANELGHATSQVAVLTVDFPIRQLPNRTLYAIQSGRFTVWGGFSGRVVATLPYARQKYVELRTNTYSRALEMRFLDQNLQPVEYPINQGTVSGATIRFYYSTVYPSVLLPTLEAIMDYRASNYAGSLRISGSLMGVDVPCCDWIDGWEHSAVVAEQIPIVLSRVNPETIDLCWNTLSNRTYQIQSATLCTTNFSNWSTTGIPLQGNGKWMSATMPRTPAQTFYRVIASP